MSKACKLARYLLALYARSSRCIMQATALMLFVAVLYATAPADVVSDFSLSAVVVFFLMAWAGFGMPDPVMEQLLLLKAGSAARLRVGEALALFILGAVGGAVSVLYPVIVNLFMGGHLFKSPLTAEDVLLGFALSAAAGFSGGITGSFFHPRVVEDRKLAALLTLLLSVLGLIKQGLSGLWPPLSALGWLLPPLADAAVRVSGKEAFAPGDVLLSAGGLILYGCALGLVRHAILERRKY
jgi:hypothetical protein